MTAKRTGQRISSKGKKSRSRWTILLLLLVTLVTAILLEPELRDLLLPPLPRPAPAYDHDRFGTRPVEHLRQFEAFVTSFDGADDDTGDGLPDTLRIPQWVAYELRRHQGPLPRSERPRRWATDPELVGKGLAATDESYQYSKEFRETHPDWYVRGHLAMKYHAERISPEAARHTHTLVNAVPQREKFNSGIWQDLECLTEAWANEYGAVWIVTGPVFLGRQPKAWLGEPEKGERRIAVPEALFKVVIRESDDPARPSALGFLYPQQDAAYERGPYPHAQYLASIDSIETLTGLDLLAALPESVQQELERVRPSRLWPVAGKYFGPGCRRSREYAEARSSSIP